MNKVLSIISISILLLVILSILYPYFPGNRWGEDEIIKDFIITDAFPGIKLSSITDIHQHNKYLYAASQDGRIYRFLNDDNANETELVLDISSQVIFEGELGLLSFTFHPNFESNGLVYIDYTTNINEKIQTRISQFNTINGLIILSSEKILFEIEQPFKNHNGGQLLFGQDGYLYISLGDGGSGGDPHGNAQNLTNLFGSILRIDVDINAGDLPYSIPDDNPFVGNSDGWREEIYAYGFRNPWRMAQDPATGKIWIGDVGQDEIEEVDILVKGSNYGWNIREGLECYKISSCNDPEYDYLVDPIHTYTHEDGAAITGGYVYRGPLTELQGKYIYGDYISGKIWAISENDGEYSNSLIGRYLINVVSFAVDNDQQFYIISRSDSTIYTFAYA